MFLFGVKKIICTAPWRRKTTFLEHFESKCLYISVYLSKKMFVSKIEQDFIWCCGRLMEAE